MIQNKKDPKIRFQQSRFQRELQKARGYKRIPGKIPEKPWEKFFAKLGILSLKTRLITAATILVVAYLLFVPNFLTIRHIQITGVSGNEQSNIENLTKNYLTAHPLLIQKNLLFTSKNSLADYLQKNDNSIFKVGQIKKRYFNTIIIPVEPHVETYALQTKAENIILFQDGIFSRALENNPSSTPFSALTVVKILEPGQITSENLPLKGSDLLIFRSLQDVMNQGMSQPAAYFEISTINSPDVYAYTLFGSKIVFDRNPDIPKITEQLQQLWSHLSDAQKKNIYYIDMRVPDRGFVCLKNTPCTETYQPINPTTTTTTLVSLQATSSTSSAPIIKPK
jgi:cell division septal protein FtsQ